MCFFSIVGYCLLLFVERCSLFVVGICLLRVVRCCLMCVDRSSSLLLVVGCVSFVVFGFRFVCLIVVRRVFVSCGVFVVVRCSSLFVVC